MDKPSPFSELFIGLVSPMGTGGGKVAKGLREAFESHGWRAVEVRVVNNLFSVEGTPSGEQIEKVYYYDELITRGDSFCETLQRGDALLGLALDKIRETRRSDGNTVYILRSLKRTAEVQTLRAIYGPAFCLVAIHQRYERRLKRLSDKLKGSSLKAESTKSRAEELILRDTHEPNTPFGQDVQLIFGEADYFVDARRAASLTASVRRLVEGLLSDPFFTPTIDEYGLALAKTAALRSADIPRQVGAAILDSRGAVLAAGTNEVPRALGGVFSEGDPDDARDFVEGRNTSYIYRRRALADVISRLLDAKILVGEWSEKIRQDPEAAAEEMLQKQLIKKPHIMNLLEFGRTVHAEMVAITDAARKGISIDGATLYSTTFPCHECTRHIISSGIHRVVYVEPYPKSLAEELFGESIAFDPETNMSHEAVRFEPFLGVSPSRYSEFFTMHKRKGEGTRSDRVIEWHKRARFMTDPRIYKEEENLFVDELAQAMNSAGMTYDWKGDDS